jgi:hypothetical protein
MGHDQEKPSVKESLNRKERGKVIQALAQSDNEPFTDAEDRAGRIIDDKMADARERIGRLKKEAGRLPAETREGERQAERGRATDPGSLQNQ